MRFKLENAMKEILDFCTMSDVVYYLVPSRFAYEINFFFCNFAKLQFVKVHFKKNCILILHRFQCICRFVKITNPSHRNWVSTY